MLQRQRSDDAELRKRCRVLELKRPKEEPDSNPRALRILQCGMALAPFLVGMDKLVFHVVTWDQYLSPVAWQVLDGYGNLFLKVSGLLEIVASIGMFIRPRL